MRKAKWLVMFLIAIAVAVPASAVELSLGGFPSYMSTRARYIENATYKSAASEDDAIFFVDTTLRVTPQLVLSDAVTVRAQVDIFDNNIWGGRTDQLLGGASTLVNSGISPSDKFRGALLHGNATTDCLAFGNNCAVEDDAGFFNVRMLHADIVLPNNLGFVRVGRQPFDWGLGILANGGWDPNSDGGFLVDRFLWLKTFPTSADASLTAIFVSDRITQGTGLHTGGGDGWDGGAVAFVFNHANMGGVNVTLGGYLFPYIHQDDFLGEGGAHFGNPPGSGFGFGQLGPGNGFGDLDRFTLYSALVDLKADSWKFTGELQGGFGEIKDILGNGSGINSKIKNALLFAIRAEYLAPTLEYINVVGAEFGWADGDKNTGNWAAGEDVEGGVIVFNQAYNLDNLLFKHVMPSIYQNSHANIITRADASVQNAYYARLYADVPVTDRVSFRPQVLVGWNNETEGLMNLNVDTNTFAVIGDVPNAFTDVVSGATYGANGTGKNINANGDLVDTAGRKAVIVNPGDVVNEKVSSYLGTEIEGDVKIKLHDGVNLNIIGSLIVAGDGLTTLLEHQAIGYDTSKTYENLTDASEVEGAVANYVNSFEAEDIIWGVQTKLTILIDEFFKSDA